jgi:hypothetical protein
MHHGFTQKRCISGGLRGLSSQKFKIASNTPSSGLFHGIFVPFFTSFSMHVCGVFSLRAKHVLMVNLNVSNRQLPTYSCTVE